MKKILTIMLGLSIAVGALSLYGGDATDTTKSTAKSKKTKATKTKAKKTTEEKK